MLLEHDVGQLVHEVLLPADLASKNTTSWALVSLKLMATPSSTLATKIWRAKVWRLRCPLMLLAAYWPG
jgi:hypothetical protein